MGVLGDDVKFTGLPFFKERRIIIKQKLVKLTLAIFLTLGGTLLSSIPALATAPDFTVQALLPESQTNQDISYFDLHLEPSQKETLEVEIQNNSDHSMDLTVTANTAVTNMNGVIDYSVSDQKPDSSLSVSFGDIAKLESNEVTVESQESKKVTISVEMPDTALKGIILGGITIAEKPEEGKADAQVTNMFSYSLAVVISQDSTPLDSLTKLTGVTVDQRNRRSVIVASIQNPIAKIMNDVSVDAKVYKGKQTDPMYYTKQSDMRMAPNSTMDFGVTTNDKKLQAGKYRLVAVVTSGEESWTFEEDFEITSEQANKLNETAVNLAADNTAMYLWIAASVIIVLLVIISTLFWDTSKKKKRKNKNKAVKKQV